MEFGQQDLDVTTQKTQWKDVRCQQTTKTKDVPKNAIAMQTLKLARSLTAAYEHQEEPMATRWNRKGSNDAPILAKLALAQPSFSNTT